MRSPSRLVTTASLAVLTFALGVSIFARPATGQAEGPFVVDTPALLLGSVPIEMEVSAPVGSEATSGTLTVGDASYDLTFEEGAATASGVTVGGGDPVVSLSVDGQPTTFATEDGGEAVESASLRVLPGWVSLLPPFAAIVVALVFRQVVPALLLGVWAGAWLINGIGPVAAWNGLLDVMTVYVTEALVPPDGGTGHISIVIFTMMIGGLVGIIARNGGTSAVVGSVTKWARTRRRGHMAAGLLGLVIFFDDYANTLVLGNALRPVTDKLQTSREKLAYIVDCTAAPVASIALISTWIGFEVGLIGDAVAGIGLEESGYSVFLSSLPYRFYPVLAILFVLLVAWSQRDFGPMRAAEVRALEEGQIVPTSSGEASADTDDQIEAKEGVTFRIANAIVPLGVLVFGAMLALFLTGEGDSIRDIVGSADAYGALMWGSFFGVLVAAVMSIAQRLLTLDEVVNAWFAGVKAVLFVLIILTLAWALGTVTELMFTADYLGSALGETLPPWSVPALLFIIAGITSFATGTSWGTMGILMPLAVPLTWAILQSNDMGDASGLPILYASVSTVLAGAVWGDHCSPISDTTVLSSLASGCDHIAHVRTQMPYALVVGGASVLLGLLPVGFGLPWWIGMVLAAGALTALLYTIGKPLPDIDDEIEAAAPQGAAAGAS